MAIGIFGLPLSGKTTIFNAVTRGHADTAPFRAGGTAPNVGVAKVPDPRLGDLAAISNPKRIVPAEVEYFDVPAAPEGLGATRGIGGEFLNVLQRCDALLLVARAFDDPAVPAPGGVDPYRDAADLQLEMLFSDLALIERREGRIAQQLRSAKAADRPALIREQALLADIRAGLEAETPVREQELPAEARPLLDNFQLLSAKPLIVVFNVDEGDAARAADVEREMGEALARPGVGVAAISGRLEMELAQMTPEDEAEFRESLGAGEPGLDRMIALSYRLLGLISFLTTGPDETRAWTITRGATAVEAAGKIHSDIQRGFIRAEVVSYDDLARVRSIPEARKQALLRTEGKSYVMQDGDVVNFLFNV